MKRQSDAEHIAYRLRLADAMILQGMAVDEICRALFISPNTYSHWRKRYGGSQAWQARRLQKQLACH